MGKKKVRLALGGGGARGLAHIGVLEALERAGITIDMIAGTSAGAAIGALYAQGRDISSIKNLTMAMGWKRLAPLVDLALPKSGFIEGRKIKEVLKSTIGDVAFEELSIPLACVATDIMTGEEVIINQGSVLEGVRASISVPVIFTVAKWKGRYLVDGGLVNPVPVSVLKGIGADLIIAVNVVPDISDRVQQAKGFKEPNIISVIMQSIYIGAYSLIEACLEEANIVIEPRLGHTGFGDFHRAKEFILQGKLAAEKSIPEIKKHLRT